MISLKKKSNQFLKLFILINYDLPGGPGGPRVPGVKLGGPGNPLSPIHQREMNVKFLYTF